MKGQIIQTGEHEWTLTWRGQTMRLVHVPGREWHSWMMFTDSAATRAWMYGRRGLESYHGFDSLAEVEAHYKTWRGFAALYSSEGVAA